MSVRQPRATVIGHSHTEPVAAAAAAAGSAIEVLNFWQLPAPLVRDAGRLALGPELARRLRAPVFSLIGGAVHQDVGLVVHPRRFDFVWPENPDLPLDAAAEIIPFAAVQAALLARTAEYREIMDAVRDAVSGPVFHLESPATYGPEEVPRDDPGFFHFFGPDPTFSPRWLRYKLWRVHSAIIAAHCRATGIEFVPHPPQSVDAEGFLKAEYHGTPAHANLAYGRLLLGEIERLAAGAGAEARAPEPVAARRIVGTVRRAGPHLLQGTAHDADRPEAWLVIEAHAGGVFLGDAVACGAGEDFAIALDAAALAEAGPEAAIIVAPRGLGPLDGSPLPAGTADRDGAAPPIADFAIRPRPPWKLGAGLAGYVDCFGPGEVEGWAQSPADPSTRVTIELREDGQCLGTITARHWRRDLEEFHQGDGRWGIAEALPASLADGRWHIVTLTLADGTAVLDHPVALRVPPRLHRPAARFQPPVSQHAIPSRRSRPPRGVDDGEICFSFVVNFYNMRREAERTLTSLTRGYQRNIGALPYEVICIDNFSDPPLDAGWVAGFGPEFRLVRPTQRLASPCAAINEAAFAARGRHVAIMIDGAHLLTPGALREAWDAVTEAPAAVVALRPWFVGGDQRWLGAVGYTRAQEDMLFDKIGWPADGYALFRIGGPYWESPRPWFDAMIESNCLFVPRGLFRAVGGMDERFAESGAGYANLDLFRRATEASPEPVVGLVGEATFHQFHEGTTTNVSAEVKDARVRAYESRYIAIAGQPYPVTNAVDIRLRGQIRTLDALASWHRPSSPAGIGVTGRVRRGQITHQFDDDAQDYLTSVYVENDLAGCTRWLGHTLDMAPSDAIAIQDIMHRQLPEVVVAVNAGEGVIRLVDSVLTLLELPASRIVSVGAPVASAPHRLRQIAGPAAAALAATGDAVAGAETILVLFAPDPEDLLPVDALRAYARLVTLRSYLVFLRTARGQPWLGYSRAWHLTAIRRLMDTGSFAIDQTINPHLLSTSPQGYLQRIAAEPGISG